MSVTVRMPQLGETVMEGTILRWAKQPGESIAEDEVLLEVSTDKVDTEVPSPTAGVVLEILVAAGETVPVGTPLALIGVAGEMPAAPPAPPAAAAAPAVAEAPATVPVLPAPEPAAQRAGVEASTFPAGGNGESSPSDLGFLSPVVRRLAAEHGLDLRQVAGTGREGRVTRKDVQGFIDAQAQGAPMGPSVAPEMPVVEILPATPAYAAPAAPVAAAPVVAAPPPAVVAVVPPAAPVAVPPAVPVAVPVAVPPAVPVAVPVAAPPSAVPAKRVGLGRGIGALIPTQEAPVPTAAPAGPAAQPASVIPLREGDRVEEASRLRMRIAERMVASRRTAAHVWTVVEVDYEAVEQVRRRLQAGFREREGFSLTYLPFIARATVDALNAFPVVNSSFYLEEKKQVFHRAVNLGIAVDIDQRGLIVMNIVGADGMRMRELARRIRAAADKARRGDLTPDDAAGSTFTISNPGPYGSLMLAPIINQPEVGILSTDSVVKRPVVVTDPAGIDAIAIHHVGNLGFTWDHRAFDGSTAVLFVRRIKEILETRDWEQELA
jgi:pyruvate dehydrogenase E2 component (dihydrolipoamide acetyltransferase)